MEALTKAASKKYEELSGGESSARESQPARTTGSSATARRSGRGPVPTVAGGAGLPF